MLKRSAIGELVSESQNIKYFKMLKTFLADNYPFGFLDFFEHFLNEARAHFSSSFVVEFVT